MTREMEKVKEEQISKVMASIENRVRHAYNQGYEQGLKDSKQETCEQIKWERDTAIKQLNELGYGFGEKIKPCEDAISRQHLIDIATTDGAYDYVSAQEIANAPSVNPQPKKGYWIQEPNGWIRCSRCSDHFPQTSYEPIIGTNYCPNCGARMESEE